MLNTIYVNMHVELYFFESYKLRLNYLKVPEKTNKYDSLT